jgi:UrcA family protein
MSQFTIGSARSRTGFALLLLGAAAVMAAGTASAASPAGDVPTFIVKYNPQSLNTDAGVNELYRRIMHAAKEVCPDASIRDFNAQRQVEACRSQAIARAVSQIDNSQLAALYAVRSKNG